MTKKQKHFYYFIGDAFSLELLEFLRSKTELSLIPVSQNQKIDANEREVDGIIYTPSLNLKEISVLEQLSANVRKIAVIDLFHFDFCDFQASFQKMSPDIIFSPLDVSSDVKEFVIVPSFIKMIYSQVEKVIPVNQRDLCFISQPLQEERSLAFNQYELAIECQKILNKIAPEKKVIIKPHPREDVSKHKSFPLFQESPSKALKHFQFFIGYNSAMLYAAQGLGKNVQMYNSLESVTPEVMASLFSQTAFQISPTSLDGLSLFIDKLLAQD